MSYTDDFVLNFGSAQTGKAASVRLRFVNSTGGPATITTSTVTGFGEIWQGTGSYIKSGVTVPSSVARGFYGATTSSTAAVTTDIQSLRMAVYSTARADKLDYLDKAISSRTPTSDWTQARSAKIDYLDVSVASRASTAGVDTAIANLPTTVQMDAYLNPLATTGNVDTAITAGIVNLPTTLQMDAYLAPLPTTAEIDTAITAGIVSLPTTVQMDAYMAPLATTANVDSALGAYNAATTANVDTALSGLNNLSSAQVENAVWNSKTTGHTSTGSVGRHLYDVKRNLLNRMQVTSSGMKVFVDGSTSVVAYSYELSDDGTTVFREEATT